MAEPFPTPSDRPYIPAGPGPTDPQTARPALPPGPDEAAPPAPQPAASVVPRVIDPADEALLRQALVPAAPEPKKPDPDPLSRWAWARLGLNLAFGVALLAWVRAFTGWWEAVTTVLALGGILSWLGFVFQVVPEEHQKTIRAGLTAVAFTHWASWLVVGGLGALLMVSLCVGVVEVENATGPGEAVVWLTEGTEAEKVTDGERIRSGDRVREQYRVWPGEERQVRVHPAGLPSRVETVRPWWRWAWAPARVKADGSFLKPVVLVGASPAVTTNAAKLTYKLEIRVNGKPIANDALKERYRGRLTFVGTADADVEIPARLKADENWEGAFRQPGHRLYPPVALPTDLKAGDYVQAVLIKEDGKEYAPSPVASVHQPRDRSEVVQGVLLSEVAP